MSSRRLEAYAEAATAKSFGLNIATLRTYRDRGLLTPLEFDGRLYFSEKDRTRLKVIQKATRLGFSLADIAALLGERREKAQPTVRPLPPAPHEHLASKREFDALLAQTRFTVLQSRTLIAQSARVPLRAWDYPAG